jgi:WD40 repeat protein
MTFAAPLIAPYKGLAPFEDSELDALLFFGRERECEVIVANLLASPLTVLYGPSGVGKSSILRAGVARRLREEAPEATVEVLDEWAGDVVLPAVAGDAFVLLDQFEESFLYDPDGRSLSVQLPELLARPGVHVLLSLREDALAKLDAFQARIPSILANRLRLDHLDRAAAHAAILGPLERHNAIAPPGEAVSADPALVDAVLEQVAAADADIAPTDGRGGRIEAPYLQLVLERVWDEERARGSRQLRLRTLDELGGARTIVQDHLQRALGALPLRDAEVATSALKFLVTPSRTKIAHSLNDLVGYTEESPVELRTVLERLALQRIVRAVPSDGEEGRYEIFHDVLAEPVLAWRRDFEERSAVDRARADAERRQRRLVALALGALLLAGALAALTAWALTQRSDARHQAAVARGQRALAQRNARAASRALGLASVQAGIAKRQRAAAVEQRNNARTQEQLAQKAAKRATAAKLEAEREAGIAQRAGERAIAAGALAKTRQHEAIAQAANAKRQEVRAHTNAKRANANARRARANAERAKARELAATAVALINVHPLAAVRRALEAAGLEPSARTENVLRQAVVADRLRRILPAGGAVASSSFSPSGSRVLTVGAGGARLFSTGGALVRRLGDASVAAARFSPDGALVATAGAGGVRLWDGRDGSPLRTLGTAAAASVAFSADGRRLAAAVGDAAAVWSRDGVLLATLPQPGPVTSVQLTPDGDRAVAVAVDADGHIQARVFTVAGGGMLERVLPERGITSAGFSPDGRLVATTSNDKTARFWSAATGSELARMTSDGHLLGAAFSRDGSLLVTANEAGGATVWQVPSGARAVQMVGPTNKVESAAFSPDAHFVAISSLDHTVRVFRTSDGLQVALLAGHAAGVRDAEFSPDGRRVVSAGDDGTARIWDTGAGDLLSPILRHQGVAEVARFSPDGRHVVSAGDDGTARLWPGGHVLRHGGPVRDAVFSPDSTLVATASDDGRAALWRVADGHRLLVLPAGAAVGHVVFSPDGSLVATGSAKGTVALWRTATGAPVGTLGGLHGSIGALAFDAAGTRLAAGDAAGTTAVWAPATGSVLRLRGDGAVSALAFSPDGSRLAAAGAGGDARLWSLPRGDVLAVLHGHTGALTDIEYSRDGRTIVTSSADSDARLWDGRTGASLRVLSGHFGSVQAASFSPDGRFVVTAGPFTAGLWTAASGQLFSPTGSGDPYLRGPTLRLTSASFSPDGARILVSSADGSVAVYRCRVCGGLGALRSLGRTLVRDVSAPLRTADG